MLVNKEWEHVNFAILDQSFDIAVYAVVNTTVTSSEETACRGLGRLMRQINVMKCVKTQTLQIQVIVHNMRGVSIGLLISSSFLMIVH